MADVHTKAQRSKNMAAIKSRYNKSTETVLVKIFRSEKIYGWRRHSYRLPGTPDFIFPEYNLVIFVDGCFWHGCKKCNLKSKTNKNFWSKKFYNNKKRDKNIRKELSDKGWFVMRFWEHQIKNQVSLNKIIKKIKKVLNKKQ